MLTFFALPKAFEGHTAVIQRNAIRSWLQLRPACQVLLIGDDPGTAETASEFGVRHLPDVERSPSGTPLISSIFSLAESAADNPLLCYINSDIILLDDFIPSVQSITRQPSLVVGRRWDMDVDSPIDFSDGWEPGLRRQLAQKGKLHSISGMDYFVYNRGLFGEIPPFAIGRTAWDCWLIYAARRNRAAVIDASARITIIHQNHGYAHIKKTAPGVFKGPEAVKNLELAGNGKHMLTLEHATHRLTGKGLERARKPRDFYFRIDAVARLHPALGFLRWPLIAIMKIKHLFSKPA